MKLLAQNKPQILPNLSDAIWIQILPPLFSLITFYVKIKKIFFASLLLPYFGPSYAYLFYYQLFYSHTKKKSDFNQILFIVKNICPFEIKYWGKKTNLISHIKSRRWIIGAKKQI